MENIQSLDCNGRHNFQLSCMPGCDFCFGALYTCTECLLDDQLHEGFCPCGEIPDGYRLVETLSWFDLNESPRLSLRQLEDDDSIILAQSNRDPKKVAVWYKLGDTVALEALRTFNRWAELEA
jgi:hypothetical protein